MILFLIFFNFHILLANLSWLMQIAYCYSLPAVRENSCNLNTIILKQLLSWG